MNSGRFRAELIGDFYDIMDNKNWQPAWSMSNDEHHKPKSVDDDTIAERWHSCKIVHLYAAETTYLPILSQVRTGKRTTTNL